MGEMRLQKFLAESGVASRRKAEELIKQGRVSVNGSRVIELGTKVSKNDLVKLDGKKVAFEEHKVYVMLNKPTGYVTTVKDQFARKTVIGLVDDISERIYPVGRLDYDTSGLLILTNDGEFTYKLTHPRHEIEKTYVALVKGVPSWEEVVQFERGLRIDNYTTAPAKFKLLSKDQNSSTVEITIHEGKNRQVRKMCETIGHPVISLARIAIGKVRIGNLKEGRWRHLSEDELKWLNT